MSEHINLPVLSAQDAEMGNLELPRLAGWQGSFAIPSSFPWSSRRLDRADQTGGVIDCRFADSIGIIDLCRVDTGEKIAARKIADDNFVSPVEVRLHLGGVRIGGRDRQQEAKKFALSDQYARIVIKAILKIALRARRFFRHVVDSVRVLRAGLKGDGRLDHGHPHHSTAHAERPTRALHNKDGGAPQ